MRHQLRINSNGKACTAAEQASYWRKLMNDPDVLRYFKLPKDFNIRVKQ